MIIVTLKLNIWCTVLVWSTSGYS